MGKYGNAAVLAIKLINEKSASTPNEAWHKSVLKIFPNSKESQEKGCPRAAFLGLCEEGMILNIPKGKYCRSLKNKGYALKALSILMSGSNLVLDEGSLWLKVLTLV